jgi:uncharacterized protein (TIGR00730 family)
MENDKQKNKKIKTAPLPPDPCLPLVKEDFRKTFQKRIFRIMTEFIEGFRFIADFKKAVTIFGSTSSPPQDHYYQEARKLGKLLAKANYAVITGGGPGIMEAANRGSFEAGGRSVGLNIQLPEGQRMNPYVKSPFGFNYFFARKVMLSFASQAYVFFPGGFGTLDEFFEMVTLIQTKKIVDPVPIIVVGKEYWQPLFDWLKSEVYQKQRAIRRKDLKIFRLVNSAEEAFEIIKKISK